MAFRLNFTDERFLFNSFNPNGLQEDLLIQDASTVTSIGQTVISPKTGESLIASEQNSTSTNKNLIDNLTGQIVDSQSNLTEKIIVEVESKKDSLPKESTEIAVSKETIQTIDSIISEAKKEVEENTDLGITVTTTESLLPQPEVDVQIPVENSILPLPTPPVRNVPQFNISDESFTIIRNSEDNSTKNSVTFSFSKLFDVGFDGGGLTSKYESSLLNRFIDFAKAISRFFQPRLEYHYGTEDFNKDFTEKNLQNKFKEKIDTEKQKILSNSADEIKKSEFNNSIRKNEQSANDKKLKENYLKMLEKEQISEELLVSLLKK
jgi:hypothetical protein